MFIYYNRRYLLGQGLELTIFEVQFDWILKSDQLFSSCSDVAHALDRAGLWGLGKDIDMVSLCGLLPHSCFQIDVVFGHECIIQSIDLDVNDFSTTEDKIVVHKGPIDPYALVAPGHSVGCNPRMILLHPVLDHDHFQWVECRVDCNIRHDPASSSVRCATCSSHPAPRRSPS